jgi:hypothetical protein
VGTGWVGHARAPAYELWPRVCAEGVARARVCMQCFIMRAASAAAICSRVLWDKGSVRLLLWHRTSLTMAPQHVARVDLGSTLVLRRHQLCAFCVQPDPSPK